mgnify:CR=1 FL=1
MNIIKHKYGKRTVSLLLAVILVLCPLQVRAADNKPTIEADNKPTIEIGNYIQMGTYDGKPIVWRCVANDDNGPLMLSDKVLCDYMPYDAQTNENKKTGSHRRNTWRDKFGSNHWRDSNIRSWLNSNEEAGNVKWLCGNPPTSDSVYPADKAYDQKAGFLRSFRSDELGAIRKVKQRSIVSHPEYTAGYIDAAGDDLPYNTTIDTVAEGYNGAYYEDIWDRVFLLDVKQLKTVKDNLKDYHIAQNRSNQPWNYWLRTPITTCNHDMRYVTPQGDILRAAPYLGYWGVRPAFYLNTDNYTVSNGAGTSENPYVVSALNAQEYTIDISGAERADVKGDWNVNTDEYLKLYMNEWYTTDPAYTNVTVPVYTIQKPRSDKDNMVILYCAEGYTKSQQKMFVEDVKRLWGKVLQIEPYRSMADRFNVYALCTPSEDTFKGNSTFFNATEDGIGGYKGVWRNHVLERIIGPAFIEKIHDAHIPNKTRPNENADHDYRQYDYVYKNINQFVVLANSGKYFGGSHDNKEKGIHYLIASAKDVNSAFIQRHELGHGLFHLGDEYNSGKNPVAEELYTTSLNMSATKDSKKVMWKQLLGFHHTYTCPHYDGYYPYNSSRDCLMRESTIQNDFCDVCRLQGIKVMSQLITNPPELYVAVPEVKKYKGDYRNPTENPSAFERANSSAYENYKYDRNNRLLSGDRKNSFDYRSMNGQEVELRTIIQNLSDTQAKKVTLRLWVEHSDGKTAVTRDGKQVYATKEFDIPVWDEKSKFWTKGALNYKGSNFDSGLVNCSLVYKIPENAILQQGDTIGFDIVDSATNDVLANDDTEKQPYANVTIQYQLEDGTDVPNTEPTTFTVPVGKKVDWQPPKELHSYTFVQAEGMDKAVPKEGMTIRYIYKRSEESPKPPVIKITPPQAITVANGTAYGDMNLPDKVNIATEGKTVDSAKVTWDTTTPAKGKYDPAVKTEQTVTLNGKVTCPESIDANGVPLTTTITITIRAAGIVEAPTANPTAGTYTENQSVELKSTTADATIYYTTDGSEPTITTGTPGGTTKQYTAPISVTGIEGQSNTTTIKAIAVKNDLQDSKVETFAYTIQIPEATYTVTVTNGSGTGEYAQGETVKITAGAAPGGQQFKEWEVVSGTITLASSTSETTTFTMPAEAVSVKANYEVSAKDSITSVEITGIDAPKANTALDTSADCATKGVSGTTHQITWDPSATEAGYNTSYTASVTLTAATDYEFSNSTTATINGNTATSVKKNDDGTLTVTYKFPATAKPATAKDSMINYETHVQTYGWQGEKSEGQISGTYGESKRLEGIRMHLTDTGVAGGITYRTHVQTYGWQNWKSDGEESGTSGQAKRLEAIQIKLTGEMAEKYDIYYRVHAQTYGWLGWSKNGEAAGTEGLSKRLEAIQIRLEEKGHPVDGSTANSFVSVYTTGNVRYRAHVQSYGWQGYVSDGKLSGTSGQSKRLEGINISLSPNIDGGITYRTHVQTYGWQKFVSNGTMAGTSGQSKRLEAIEIKLTGNAEKVYDVYYRVHCQHFGWLGWAKNGESAGSAGYGYRLEAIQIQLVKKGGSAPGSTSNAFQNK